MKLHKLERKSLELLKDFIKLWHKYNFDNSNLNYYDKILFEILEEYDFLLTSKRYFKTRPFDD